MPNPLHIAPFIPKKPPDNAAHATKGAKPAMPSHFAASGTSRKVATESKENDPGPVGGSSGGVDG